MTTARDLIAYVLIVGAACVGSWIMFVQPKHDELNRLEGEIARDREVLELMHDGTVRAVVTRLEQLTDRVEEIDRRSALASDSSRLFEAVMAIAEQHQVVVQNVDPGQIRRSGENNEIIVAPLTIAVDGDYANVVDFVDALDDLDGFIRQASIRLTPSATDMTVHGRITCEALGFMLPDSLRNVASERIGDRTP